PLFLIPLTLIDLITAFRDWSQKNCLQLNTSKTKEMIVDFCRSKPLLEPVKICGVDIEVVHTYRYLGVLVDDKLDWSPNTDALYRKGQSRLFFLRSLRSFDVCVEIMTMFYHTVVLVHSSLLQCAGEEALQTKTPSDWTSWSKSRLSAGQETGPTNICGGEGHTKQTGSYYGQQQTPSPQSTGATKKHLQQSLLSLLQNRKIQEIDLMMSRVALASSDGGINDAKKIMQVNT
ncbi:DUF1891 domain-containing protein, partial [Enterococcus faecium]